MNAKRAETSGRLPCVDTGKIPGLHLLLAIPLPANHFEKGHRHAAAQQGGGGGSALRRRRRLVSFEEPTRCSKRSPCCVRVNFSTATMSDEEETPVAEEVVEEVAEMNVRAVMTR